MNFSRVPRRRHQTLMQCRHFLPIPRAQSTGWYSAAPLRSTGRCLAGRRLSSRWCRENALDLDLDADTRTRNSHRFPAPHPPFRECCSEKSTVIVHNLLRHQHQFPHDAVLYVTFLPRLRDNAADLYNRLFQRDPVEAPSPHFWTYDELCSED